MAAFPAAEARPDIAPRKLGRDEINRAARALGRAFYDDPLMMYFMPSDTKRTAVMTYVLRCAVRMAIPEGESYTVDTPDNGAALFLPPGTPKVPVSRVLQTILPEAWRFGLGPIGRYLAVMKEFEPKHPAEDHWYLATLGVDPDQQGRGLGGFMMSAILRRAEAEGTTVYLETNKARNVVFYQKHGFRVDDHFNCHRGRGPETWTMLREHGQFHA